MNPAGLLNSSITAPIEKPGAQDMSIFLHTLLNGIVPLGHIEKGAEPPEQIAPTGQDKQSPSDRKNPEAHVV
jgi:hypothetical protein